MATRSAQVAVASAASTAGVVVVAALLGAPGPVLLVVAAVALAVFVPGYARSPFFARRAPGPPCPRCGGLGYRAQAYAFHLRPLPGLPGARHPPRGVLTGPSPVADPRPTPRRHAFGPR